MAYQGERVVKSTGSNTNRMVSPDIIVPDAKDPQSFNRYSYALNNPVRYTDPTGHVCYDPNLDAATPGNCGGGTSPVNELPPVPVVELQFDAQGNFDPRATWSGLSDADLLARMMLSEESYKILDPVLYEDAVGAAWSAINRTRPGSGYSYADGNLFEAIVADNQFHGMIQYGNARWAANPEAFPGQFQVNNPNAGREAYWRAYELAEGILNGEIADPTDGRLIYGDELADGTPRYRTAFWYNQGSNYDDPQDLHLTIPQIRAKQFFEIQSQRLKNNLLFTD